MRGKNGGSGFCNYVHVYAHDPPSTAHFVPRLPLSFLSFHPFSLCASLVPAESEESAETWVKSVSSLHQVFCVYKILCAQHSTLSELLLQTFRQPCASPRSNFPSSGFNDASRCRVLCVCMCVRAPSETHEGRGIGSRTKHLISRNALTLFLSVSRMCMGAVCSRARWQFSL